MSNAYVQVKKICELCFIFAFATIIKIILFSFSFFSTCLVRELLQSELWSKCDVVPDTFCFSEISSANSLEAPLVHVFLQLSFKCNSGLGFLIWTGRFQILPQHLNWKFRTLTWLFKKTQETQNEILCNGFYGFVSKAEAPVGSVGATFMTTSRVKVQGEALRCVSGPCWNDRWCDFLNYICGGMQDLSVIINNSKPSRLTWHWNAGMQCFLFSKLIWS